MMTGPNYMLDSEDFGLAFQNKYFVWPLVKEESSKPVNIEWLVIIITYIKPSNFYFKAN